MISIEFLLNISIWCIYFFNLKGRKIPYLIEIKEILDYSIIFIWIETGIKDGLIKKLKILILNKIIIQTLILIKILREIREEFKKLYILFLCFLIYISIFIPSILKLFVKLTFYLEFVLNLISFWLCSRNLRIVYI